MTIAHQMKPRYLVSLADLDASLRVDPEAPPPGPAAGLPLVLARVGIALSKRSAGDTRFTYQVGISNNTTNVNFLEWRERCPDIEIADGKVSGAVVFDGDKVIAHYTASVNHKRPVWHVGVHEDYRKDSDENPEGGLATLAIFLWFRAAPFAKLLQWPVNGYAARAVLSAHRQYLQWAIEQGEPVPQEVIDSLAA